MERLLDFDPLSGMRTWHDYDDATDTTIIRYEDDCQDILDACKEDNNHADVRKEMRGDLVHVASVKQSTQLEWFVKYGVKMWDRDHRQAVNRLLDGEYKHLKRLPIILGKAR